MITGLNLGHFHTHDHRDVHNLDELHTTAPVVAHKGHVNDLVQSFNELHLWELGCLLHVCTRELAGPRNRDVDHLINVLQLENLCGLLDKTMGICICAICS